MAHLWHVACDQVQDPELLAAYHRLMSPDEAAQQARFVFPEDRRQYLLTRALVRSVLSRYAPVAPGDWQFARSAHGRPEIVGPERAPRLRFNLSNTRSLIACLVAREREVGVDVEDLDRAGETVALAERFFSPAEAAALRALPPAEQRTRFLQLWTLKEAYIKARGLGLSLPLDAFSIQLDDPAEIGISFDHRIADQPAEWQFSLLRPSPRHLLATAIHKGQGPALDLVVRATVPLLDALDDPDAAGQ